MPGSIRHPVKISIVYAYWIPASAGMTDTFKPDLRFLQQPRKPESRTIFDWIPEFSAASLALQVRDDWSKQVRSEACSFEGRIKPK